MIHQIRYTAPADPYRPIWIDPQSVEYMNERIWPEWGLGQIVDGDWDHRENCRPLAELPRVRGLKQRFERGYDWEETAYFKQAKAKIETNGSISGYTDLDEYRAVRCAYVDDLFESIRTEGYRPNFESEHTAPEADERNNRWFWSQLEPLVVIGRHGEIFLNDGRHRFAIAKILGIESIPVNVVGRHHEWQTVRERFVHADNIESLPSSFQEYTDHPDLRDVVCS